MGGVFGFVDESSVLLWTGNPNCQAAHDEILTFLTERCPPFVPSPQKGDKILRGNLGETITFCLGSSERFGDEWLGHFANALRPFSGKSNPELDLLWVHFGPTSNEDWAVLQEVKTTSAQSISYANNLIDDFDKLFGTNARFTLQTRIQDFKNRLEFEQKRAPELVRRVNHFCGTSPAGCPRIRLLSTVVHDTSAVDVVETMLLVRETLSSKSWSDVEP
jgi:hypothetical protein